MFLYDKNGQYEVSGEHTCSLAMQSVADELKDLPGFKYEDGDLGMSTMNVHDFMKQKIGVNYASTFILHPLWNEGKLVISPYLSNL